ncbi:hypothetical protein V1478_001797 [Vespula squamosa]|uniref:Uncharacterized protein n=1 Tax=Vespula squamosa TaxID=30214 RepID=A0ABD2BY51_VESSQ
MRKRNLTDSPLRINDHYKKILRLVILRSAKSKKKKEELKKKKKTKRKISLTLETVSTVETGTMSYSMDEQIDKE